MGFEAGQHEAITSVDHHEALIWNATASTGNFREDLPELDQSQSLLKRTSGGMKVVEVRYRHTIGRRIASRWSRALEFSGRAARECLARDRTGEIKASETGLILMPLYQALGNDGFFLCVKFLVLA